MSSEYYSLEKAAEVLALPTAEVNRLREKNQLRAFRDGASWKFRKVDVDNFLVEAIKNRGKSEKPAGDSDFDLLNGDDDSEESPTLLADMPSFDSLMEDGLSLGGDDLVATAPSKSAPTNVAATAKPAAKPAEKKKDEEFALADDDLMLGGDDLTLSEDSDVLPTDLRPTVSNSSASDIDLAAGDDLVLDGTGTASGINLAAGGSGINLAGDSGLSLLDVAEEADLQSVDGGSKLELDDDDDILSLVDDEIQVENTSTIAIPVEDDFQLTADTDTGVSTFIAVEDSDSSSQVIALDEDNVFGASSESGFGSAPFAAVPAANQAEPIATPDFGASPFGSVPTGEFVTQTPAFAAAPAPVEVSYTPLQVVAIAFAALFLIFPGMMILDLIIHIWSWGEPFVINSSLMDLFAGMAGLK